MIEDRPQADRILVAQLTGEARFRARWRKLTGDEEAAAAAALRELAAGRADLLAEVAGLLEGASEGELEEPLARQASTLCWLAGADAEAVPAWIEEGRRRRDAARQPPHSGGVRGPGLARLLKQAEDDQPLMRGRGPVPLGLGDRGRIPVLERRQVPGQLGGERLGAGHQPASAYTGDRSALRELAAARGDLLAEVAGGPRGRFGGRAR
ncbi:MAG TPA: hypothetical protein VFQ68_19070 [Streptosporangiaceae bacterium]|nr:hypothetical protein [Streptosporangiaceae bacterium]